MSTACFFPQVWDFGFGFPPSASASAFNRALFTPRRGALVSTFRGPAGGSARFQPCSFYPQARRFGFDFARAGAGGSGALSTVLFLPQGAAFRFRFCEGRRGRRGRAFNRALFTPSCGVSVSILRGRAWAAHAAGLGTDRPRCRGGRQVFARGRQVPGSWRQAGACKRSCAGRTGPVWERIKAAYCRRRGPAGRLCGWRCPAAQFCLARRRVSGLARESISAWRF